VIGPITVLVRLAGMVVGKNRPAARGLGSLGRHLFFGPWPRRGLPTANADHSVRVINAFITTPARQTCSTHGGRVADSFVTKRRNSQSSSSTLGSRWLARLWQALCRVCRVQFPLAGCYCPETRSSGFPSTHRGQYRTNQMGPRPPNNAMRWANMAPGPARLAPASDGPFGPSPRASSIISYLYILSGRLAGSGGLLPRYRRPGSTNALSQSPAPCGRRVPYRKLPKTRCGSRAAVDPPGGVALVRAGRGLDRRGWVKSAQRVMHISGLPRATTPSFSSTCRFPAHACGRPSTPAAMVVLDPGGWGGTVQPQS